jgi:hypothetical protein
VSSGGCVPRIVQRYLRAGPANRYGPAAPCTHTEPIAPPGVASCVPGWLSFVFFLSVCLCESNVNKLVRIGPDRGTWIHGLLGVVASKHVAALPGSSLQKLFWLRSMDV